MSSTSEVAPDLDEADAFERRAEFLDSADFEAWTNVNDFERTVLRQMTSAGPKLLVGPRGCGKSTLLRLAALRLRQSGKDIPVLVNYGRSMMLEPAFKARGDAAGYFQDWLVARILESLYESNEGKSSASLTELGLRSREFIRRAEYDVESTPRPALMGPTRLSEYLAEVARDSGKRRVVLLLDDAAHAFLPEQQQIFFDFLTSMRRPEVTYKAAIYPGVTEFSRTFNVGHEAKLVDAWLDPDSENYLDSMRSIFRMRDLGRGSAISQELVDLFAMASFGIPRSFLAMVEAYRQATPSHSTVASAAMDSIQRQSREMHEYHEALRRKLPRMSNFVSVGQQLLDAMVQEVKSFNRENRADVNRGQALDIALRTPIEPKVRTLLNLLEYAGLVRRLGAVSIGEGYEKISINRGSLLAASALQYPRRTPSISERTLAATRKNRQFSFKRIGAESLLTAEQLETCVLQIGPCPKCGAPRPIENAKFCMNCGAAIMAESRYEELVKTSISGLELPFRKKEALREIGFDTVEDILRDRGLVEVKKARRVGEKWSVRILAAAEEYISV